MDQTNNSIIINVVIDAIGFFFKIEYAFVSQNGKMLRNVALTGANLIDYILNAYGLATQNTEYFQSKWMRHGL